MPVESSLASRAGHPLSAFFTRCKGCDLSHNDFDISRRPSVVSEESIFGLGGSSMMRMNYGIDGRVALNF